MDKKTIKYRHTSSFHRRRKLLKNASKTSFTLPSATYVSSFTPTESILPPNVCCTPPAFEPSPRDLTNQTSVSTLLPLQEEPSPRDSPNQTPVLTLLPLQESTTTFNYESTQNLSSDTEDELDVQSKDIILLNSLKEIALKHKLTHISMNDILKTLRAFGLNFLPCDSRTLLKTPSKVEIVPMDTGHFWYNGIVGSLKKALSSNPTFKEISLIFNVDGISPFESSTREFWPILFRIRDLPLLPPVVAAVYYGIGKPPLDQYFSQFVQELNHIMTNGIMVNNSNVAVKLSCFVCDTPARCFVKGVAGSNSEIGACLKCF